MKQMTAAALSASLVLALATAARGSEVAFSKRPEVRTSGGISTVSFAVDQKTDVAVYVQDAKGKVVRHLAAGVLGGENPPPEPLKPGLSQSLEWDGKDDAGVPVPAETIAEGMKVRVALGLKPEFGGFLLHHPDMLPQTYRVAVGPQGNIYYFYQDPTCNANMGGHKVRVRTREGKHVRTLVPFPADIETEEIKAFGAFQDEEGQVLPQIHNYETFSIYPTTQKARRRDTACATPVVDSKGRLYWTVTGNRMICVDAQGRCPYPSYLSGPLFPAASGVKMHGGESYLAISSDDKYLYISSTTGSYTDNGKKLDLHYVCRVDLATRAPAEPFIGNPAETGGTEMLLKNPRGIAVANGIIYIADRSNDRIVAFKESDRSYVGELKTSSPYLVCVDSSTSAIYVIAEPKPLFSELLKFDSLKATNPSAKLAFPRDWAKKGLWTMALDSSSKPARLYFPHRAYAGSPWGNAMTCFEDRPDGFKHISIPEPKARYAFWHKDLWIDQARSELYIKSSGDGWSTFDAESGTFKNSVRLKGTGGPNGGQLVCDSQGRLATYTWVHKSKRPALQLWTRDGKQIPMPGKGWSGIMTFQQKFMDIYRDELYVIPNGNPLCLNVFGMDLQPKRTVIWQCSDGCVVKTDSKGNIYLGENVRPLKRYYPKFFDGKIESGKYWYEYMYGSIVKFSPKGGAVWFKEGQRSSNAIGKPGDDVLAMPKQPFNFKKHHRGPTPPGQLQGAEWVRFGFAPYSSTYNSGTGNCQCEGAGFDVDAFGRVFYPNLGRFRIEVVDNNNNFIGTFGRYGNADSQLVPTDSKDGKPLVATPGIPLAWPTYVAAGDAFAYVGDVVNMRTVKVKLSYAVEETCEIK